MNSISVSLEGANRTAFVNEKGIFTMYVVIKIIILTIIYLI
jgi:hypothetical protein